MEKISLGSNNQVSGFKDYKELSPNDCSESELPIQLSVCSTDEFMSNSNKGDLLLFVTKQVVIDGKTYVRISVISNGERIRSSLIIRFNEESVIDNFGYSQYIE